MLTNRRIERIARFGVVDAHLAFHRVVGQKKVDHGPGYDDGVAAVLLARLEHMEDCIAALAGKIENLPKARAHRKPTAWQLYVGRIVKAGGSIQDAAIGWRERKKK